MTTHKGTTPTDDLDGVGFPSEDDYDGPPATTGERSSLPDPNAFLFPDVTPSFKFATLGDQVEGTVVEMVTKVQTDIKTGEPLTWPDGSQRLQVVATLATSLNDPDIDDDNGHRRIFIKGDMTRAVREAVKESKSKGIEPGDYLAVCWTTERAPKSRGMDPQKIFVAQHAPADAEF